MNSLFIYEICGHISKTQHITSNVLQQSMDRQNKDGNFIKF
jgi:hypothetical protein